MTFNSETIKNNSKLVIDELLTQANHETKIKEIKKTLDKEIRKDIATSHPKSYLIYILNPIENLFYLLEYSISSEKLHKRKLNEVNIMEIPLQFIEYYDYFIEEGVILSLDEICDIGQHILNNKKSKKLKILRVKNKNMVSSVITSFYDFYLFENKYTYFFKIGNLLYLNKGDKEIGRDLINRVVNTKNIIIENEKLVFSYDENLKQNIIMFDNYLKKYYRVQIFDGYYTIKQLHPSDEKKESVGLCVLDESGAKHKLFLNDQRLFFI